MCRAGGRRCPGGHSGSKSHQAARQRLSRANRALTAAEATGDTAKIVTAQQKLTAARASMDAVKQAHAHENSNQTGDVTPLPTPQPTPKPEPKPPVSGRMSDKPIAENGWGNPAAGEVNYHADGAIGTAIQDMGPHARMDVDGQPLANTLGTVATDVVAGRRTAQDGLNEYKAIRDRLPDGPARTKLTWAIDRMDAPDTPAPQVPDGTPEPMRQLVKDLHAVPIVRKDPSREMDQLLNLANDAAAGRARGGLLAFDLQNLHNRRHESDGDAGKFEIDRAINKAVADLRKPPPPPPPQDIPASPGDVTSQPQARKDDRHTAGADTSDNPGFGMRNTNMVTGNGRVGSQHDVHYGQNPPNADEVNRQVRQAMSQAGQAVAQATKLAQRATQPGDVTPQRPTRNVASGDEHVHQQNGINFGTVRRSDQTGS